MSREQSATQAHRPRIVSNGRAPVSSALRRLTVEQRATVARPLGRQLVIASAGSGKTRVLTRRAVYLIETEQVAAEQVLAITLTNRAAREMIGRLRKLCGAEQAEKVYAGTFHSMCARILRDHYELILRSPHFSIYDEKEARQVIARGMSRAEKAIISPSAVLREIEVGKHHYVKVADYGTYAADERSEIVANAWNRYERELVLADALDFSDLLLCAVDVLREHPDIRRALKRRFRARLVDEYQDTNPTQARLLRLLAGDHNTERDDGDFMAVGDDKQVIFGFRLASVKVILDFQKEYPGAAVLKLQTNHRCSPQILEAANRLIAHNKVQVPMQMKPAPDAKDGPPVRAHLAVNDIEEARWIAARVQRLIEGGVAEREIAVLAREKKIIKRLEHAFAAAGISYKIAGPGGGYFRRKEVRAALAHLRLLVNPRNEEAFVSALSVRAGVADKTIAKIADYAHRHDLTLLEAATAVDLIPGIDTKPKERIRQFGFDMLAFTARAPSMPLRELVHDVIRMRNGVAESIVTGDEPDQRVDELMVLRAAASAYERNAETPTLPGWLQDAALAGSEDFIEPGDGGRVTIGTIHATKGLEWTVVIGAGLDSRVMPSYWAKTEPAIEEERRVFYVMMTRASRMLILSFVTTREGRASGPSRFLAEALSTADTQPAAHLSAATRDQLVAAGG